MSSEGQLGAISAHGEMLALSQRFLGHLAVPSVLIRVLASFLLPVWLLWLLSEASLELWLC